MRLNKFIAQSGYCSRRKADELIETGKVSVNGKKVNEMGLKIDPKNDTIKIGRKTLNAPSEFTTVLFYKPTGVTTTKHDVYARETIYDVLPQEFHTLHSVGRLDRESEGLLILTNDGELTYRLTHPKHGSSKTYHVKVKGRPNPRLIQKLEKGIDIKEEKEGKTTRYHTQPCTITSRGPSQYEVTLKEGRNRQIRKMFLEIGHPVVYLKRLSMGPYELGDLKKGEWKVV